MKYIAILLIWLYQQTISRVFQFLGVGCRFYPSCSQYSKEAFRKHPFFKAFWLSVKRIGRCHPWGGEGVDEVPD